MPLPETFLPNLEALYRASSISSGNLTDLSGNGRTLTGTGTTTSTTSTANGWGIDGLDVVTSNGLGSNYFTASSAAPWEFLHYGPSSLYAVFRATHAGTKPLLDTGGYSVIYNGMFLQFDGDRGRVGFDYCKNGPDILPDGGDVGRIIDYAFAQRFSWSGTVEPSVPHLLVLTVDETDNPDIHVYLDGHLIDTLSIGDRERGVSSLGTPVFNEGRHRNPGAPGFPLRLFAQANAVINIFAGELAEIGFSSSRWSSTIRTQLEDEIETRYGFTFDRTKPGKIYYIANSLTDNVWRPDGAHPDCIQWPEIMTPSLSLPQINAMRAVVGIESNQLETKLPKHVAADYDSSRPFNVAVVWEMVNEVADGATKEEALANYWSLCDAVRAIGIKVVCAPMLPHLYTTEAEFEWLKAAVLGEWTDHADAIARPDLDANIGNWAAFVSDYGYTGEGITGGTGPHTYRYSDGVHFTALSNTILAPYFLPPLESLITVTPRRRVILRGSHV